ncbi:MAG: bifunctional glutamate N-acetyltransferase/amino-acid acetyltransferase ArgJ [Spirochaetales bacterium]|nr:bifunctional glutamate N-acetyltransferase/amino-acid acetyltransferase ArgJ [Spirochaetales bacterium]
MEYSSAQDYRADLERRAALPDGFSTATVALTFEPKERPVPQPLPMKLNLLVLDEPTAAFAGLFTRNAFPGAPVILGRELLSRPLSRGVLINNKIANVGGPTALADARALQSSVAAVFASPSHEFFVASTGIIGWSLPVAEMTAVLPSLADALQSKSALGLAEGIMTTDAYPKVRSRSLFGGRVVAVAKGAGMIEPNLATMLVYVMTDLEVSRASLRDILARTVDKTLNHISVDGDQSTSDMVLAFSSQRFPCPDQQAFERALEEVLRELAQDIVRNGEGTSHVLEIRVNGAETDAEALVVAKAVANSPLVKTAVFGNDPNVGRVLSAVGDALGNAGKTLERAQMVLVIAGQTVFDQGVFLLSPEKEKHLSSAFQAASQPERKEGYPRHENNVVFEVTLGKGRGSSTVWGSDLSYEYVRENADYRS